MGNSGLSTISVNSVSGGSQAETLVYEENYIEKIYGQDCGSYTVSFEPVDPSVCDMSSLLSVDAKSGSGGPNSHAFSQ